MDTNISGIGSGIGTSVSSNVGSTFSGLAGSALSTGMSTALGGLPGLGLNLLSQQLFPGEKKCGHQDQGQGMNQVLDRLFGMLEMLLSKLLEGVGGGAQAQATTASSASGSTGTDANTSGSTASEAGAATVSSSPNNTSSVGSEEFLWKPVSDKDGRLAILLPSSLTGKVASVEIQDSKGKNIEMGKAAGAGNGHRLHFRFSKSGGKYPAKCKVVIHLKDGSTRGVEIAKPGQRKATKKVE